MSSHHRVELGGIPTQVSSLLWFSAGRAIGARAKCDGLDSKVLATPPDQPWIARERGWLGYWVKGGGGEKGFVDKQWDGGVILDVGVSHRKEGQTLHEMGCSREGERRSSWAAVGCLVPGPTGQGGSGTGKKILRRTGSIQYTVCIR